MRGLRKRRRPLTNEERLKMLYVAGKLTLDALMEQIDAQLAAGTLDDAPVVRRSPADVAARWEAGVSGAAPSWTAPRARDTLAGTSGDE